MRAVFELTGEGLAAVRFALFPAGELVASLQRRAAPGRHPACAPWEAELPGRLAPLSGGERAWLDALLGPRHWAPDSLTPLPDGPERSVAQELATIASLPPQRLLDELEELHGALPAVIAEAAGDPVALLARVVTILRRYWSLALAPDWPRLRAVLRGDIAARSADVVAGGLEALFAGLHPTVVWQDGRLVVDAPPDGTVRVDGCGLPLVPSAFARSPLLYADQERPPVLVYPARGAALAWAPPAPAAALGELLGTRRAALLLAVGDPVTLSDAAALAGVPVSSAHDHLGVLARAGLVERQRVGRHVLHRRTRTGEGLLVSD